MNLPVFLDTSGLIAVVNNDDQWHSVAESVWGSLIRSAHPLITTSLVLTEIGDGLSHVRHRQLAVDLYDRMRSNSRVDIVRPSAEEEARGWGLFRQRHDKDWGMTDCLSMLIAQGRSVRDVFSSDHHFEQAGFNILLKR